MSKYKRRIIDEMRALLDNLEGALDAESDSNQQESLLLNPKMILHPTHPLYGTVQPANIDKLTIITNHTDLGAVKEENLPPIYENITVREKFKSGLLEYRFTIDGKQHSVYGHSKKECWQKRESKIGRKPTEKTTVSPSAQQLSFAEWIEHWWKTYKVEHLGAQSAARSRGIIDKHILPELGRLPLKGLNHDGLQVFINGYTSMPNSQKKIYDIIHGSLEKARRSGKIKTNPADGIELKRYTKKKRQALQIAEQLRAYNLLKARNEKYLKLFFFCCCTGIRIGRVLELTEKNFDFENNEIIVKMKQKLGLEETYRLPFLPELLDGLPKKGKLFAEVNLSSAQDFFKNIFKELDINDVTIHSFRHTFISTLRFLKVEFEQIKEWVGHKTLAMTTDVYTHIIKNNGSSPILTYLQRLKDSQNL